MFALQVHNKYRISIDKAHTNSTGWAKDSQSSHLTKPSLHLNDCKISIVQERHYCNLTVNIFRLSNFSSVLDICKRRITFT